MAGAGRPILDWGKRYSTIKSFTDAVAFQERVDGEAAGREGDPGLVLPVVLITIGIERIDGMESLLTDFRPAETSFIADAGLDLKAHFNLDPGSHVYCGTKIPLGGKYSIGACEATDSTAVLEKPFRASARSRAAISRFPTVLHRFHFSAVLRFQLSNPDLVSPEFISVQGRFLTPYP